MNAVPRYRLALALAAATRVVIVGVVLIGSTAALAVPDATPAPNGYARYRLAIAAWEHRRVDGTVSRRRQVRNQLDLRAAAPRVAVHLSALYAFDAGLPSRPSNALARQLQLEPELAAAYIRWRPLPSVRATAGRHDWAGVDGFARIDGVSARAAVGDWTLQLGTGLRPDDRGLRIDGWAYALDTDPTLESRLSDRTWFLAAGARYDAARGALGLGFRNERAVDGRFHDGTRAAFVARGGRVDGVRVDAGLVAVAQLVGRRGGLERAHARLSVPVSGALTLLAEERYSEPHFPASSIFSVFPRSARRDTSIGVAWAADRAAVHVSAYHRALGVGTLRTELGGRVRASLDGPDAAPISSRFSLGFDGHGNDERSALRVSAGTHLTFPRHLQVHVRQTIASARSAASNLPRRTGTYTSVGLGGVAGRWADLQATAITGWDGANRWSTRVMATADISLPGRR